MFTSEQRTKVHDLKATKQRLQNDDSLSFVKNFRTTTKKKPVLATPLPHTLYSSPSPSPDHNASLPPIPPTNPLINLDKLPSMPNSSSNSTVFAYTHIPSLSPHEDEACVSVPTDSPGEEHLARPRKALILTDRRAVSSVLNTSTDKIPSFLPTSLSLSVSSEASSVDDAATPPHTQRTQGSFSLSTNTRSRNRSPSTALGLTLLPPIATRLSQSPTVAHTQHVALHSPATSRLPKVPHPRSRSASPDTPSPSLSSDVGAPPSVFGFDSVRTHQPGWRGEREVALPFFLAHSDQEHDTHSRAERAVDDSSPSRDLSHRAPRVRARARARGIKGSAHPTPHEPLVGAGGDSTAASAVLNTALERTNILPMAAGAGIVTPPSRPLGRVDDSHGKTTATTHTTGTPSAAGSARPVSDSLVQQLLTTLSQLFTSGANGSTRTPTTPGAIPAGAPMPALHAQTLATATNAGAPALSAAPSLLPTPSLGRQSTAAAASASQVRYEYPSQVNDLIYIGGVSDARNKTRLLALNIEYVLNLAPQHVPCFFPTDFIYKTVALPKDGTALLAELDSVFAFLDLVSESAGRVLVHDETGVARSVACVVAYVAKTYGFTLEQSYLFVKSKRRETKIPPHIWVQLGDWEVRTLGSSTLAKIVLVKKKKESADEGLNGFLTAGQARAVSDEYEQTVSELQRAVQTLELLQVRTARRTEAEKAAMDRGLHQFVTTVSEHLESLEEGLRRCVVDQNQILLDIKQYTHQHMSLLHSGRFAQAHEDLPPAVYRLRPEGVRVLGTAAAMEGEEGAVAVGVVGEDVAPQGLGPLLRDGAEVRYLHRGPIAGDTPRANTAVEASADRGAMRESAEDESTGEAATAAPPAQDTPTRGRAQGVAGEGASNAPTRAYAGPVYVVNGVRTRGYVAHLLPWLRRPPSPPPVLDLADEAAEAEDAADAAEAVTVNYGSEESAFESHGRTAVNSRSRRRFRAPRLDIALSPVSPDDDSSPSSRAAAPARSRSASADAASDSDAVSPVFLPTPSPTSPIASPHTPLRALDAQTLDEAVTARSPLRAPSLQVRNADDGGDDGGMSHSLDVLRSVFPSQGPRLAQVLHSVRDLASRHKLVNRQLLQLSLYNFKLNNRVQFLVDLCEDTVQRMESNGGDLAMRAMRLERRVSDLSTRVQVLEQEKDDLVAYVRVLNRRMVEQHNTYLLNIANHQTTIYQTIAVYSSTANNYLTLVDNAKRANAELQRVVVRSVQREEHLQERLRQLYAYLLRVVHQANKREQELLLALDSSISGQNMGSYATKPASTSHHVDAAVDLSKFDRHLLNPAWYAQRQQQERAHVLSRDYMALAKQYQRVRTRMQGDIDVLHGLLRALVFRVRCAELGVDAVRWADECARASGDASALVPSDATVAGGSAVHNSLTASINADNAEVDIDAPWLCALPVEVCVSVSATEVSAAREVERLVAGARVVAIEDEDGDEGDAAALGLPGGDGADIRGTPLLTGAADMAIGSTAQGTSAAPRAAAKQVLRVQLPPPQPLLPSPHFADAFLEDHRRAADLHALGEYLRAREEACAAADDTDSSSVDLRSLFRKGGCDLANSTQSSISHIAVAPHSSPPATDSSSPQSPCHRADENYRDAYMRLLRYYALATHHVHRLDAAAARTRTRHQAAHEAWEAALRRAEAQIKALTEQDYQRRLLSLMAEVEALESECAGLRESLAALERTRAEETEQARVSLEALRGDLSQAQAQHALEQEQWQVERTALLAKIKAIMSGNYQFEEAYEKRVAELQALLTESHDKYEELLLAQRIASKTHESQLCELQRALAEQQASHAEERALQERRMEQLRAEHEEHVRQVLLRAEEQRKAQEEAARARERAAEDELAARSRHVEQLQHALEVQAQRVISHRERIRSLKRSRQHVQWGVNMLQAHVQDVIRTNNEREEKLVQMLVEMKGKLRAKGIGVDVDAYTGKIHRLEGRVGELAAQLDEARHRHEALALSLAEERERGAEQLRGVTLLQTVLGEAAEALLQQRMWLGMEVAQDALDDGSRVRPGLRVEAVLELSPCAAAGLRVGDVVISLNGAPLYTVADVSASLQEVSVGAVLLLHVERTKTAMQVAADAMQRGSCLVGLGGDGALMESIVLRVETRSRHRTHEEMARLLAIKNNCMDARYVARFRPHIPQTGPTADDCEFVRSVLAEDSARASHHAG